MENKEHILAALRNASIEKGGKRYITCARVFELAEHLGIERRLAGDFCNEADIKISGCQLGCFD